jgi:DNA gyrase subunit A
LADNLLVFTHSGKAYQVPLQAIPAADPRSRQSKGTPLVTLLSESAQTETLVSQWLAIPEPNPETELVVLTQQGRLKRINFSEFSELTGRGLSFCKLKEPDQVFWVGLVAPDGEIAIVTSAGRVLRFSFAEIPTQARTAAGQPSLRLGKQEHLVGVVSLQSFDNLILLTQQGYAKQLPISAVRSTHLGEMGTQALQFASRQDQLVGIASSPAVSSLVVITNQNRFATLEVNQIPLWGKDGPGQRLLKPNADEKIIEVIA